MSDENNKVSIKVFHWFEKMKNNYDENVQGMLKRFEQYNDKQQTRVDQSHLDHISHLKDAHQNQIKQQDKHLAQCKDDIDYYKQQIAEQQQLIAQLNNRYDAVVGCLIEQKHQKADIKDIFSDQDFVTSDNSERLESNHDKTESYSKDSIAEVNVDSPVESEEIEKFESPIEANIEAKEKDPIQIEPVTEELTPIIIEQTVQNATLENDPVEKVSEKTETSTKLKSIDGDELFEQAIAYRQLANNEQAFLLFEQAAQQGHVKAMGAMGRSFFLGEGIEENQSIGLAWLINAANQGHPQAIARSEHFQEHNPELYSEALTLSEELVAV